MDIHENPKFIEYIKSLLRRATLNEKHVDLLTTQEDMIEWTKVFTSEGISKFNYQLYETFGDVTCNKIVVWYYKQRFPKVFDLKAPVDSGEMGPVDILSKLKCFGISKESFGKFGKNLGFLDFIRSTDEEKQHSQKISEDVFESFVGCLENLINMKIGDFVGYGICYTFMKPLLDKEEVSLKKEDLYDSKSLVNQIATKYRQFISITYNPKDTGEEKNYRERFHSVLEIVERSSGKVIYTSSEETGADIKEAEKKTAKHAWKSGIFEQIKKMYPLPPEITKEQKMMRKYKK
jgi:dsRNA-specific ribonuclease